MTVDLGWPWWVTSLVALGVTVICGFALLRTRQLVVRGVLATLAIQGVALAALAPAVMSDTDSAMPGMRKATMGPAPTRSRPAPRVKTGNRLPFTFFLTHYEFLGDPDNPTGVRYHSNGRLTAKAPDGSTIVLSGSGAWDPAPMTAEGGGRYAIRSAAGKTVASGRWRTTRFVSFQQVAGWYGFPFREEGWQGPRGSVSFSGFLKVAVTLEGRGAGLLTAWCIMGGVKERHGHQSDGLALTGPALHFTAPIEFGESGSLEGVMFYGPGTGSSGIG